MNEKWRFALLVVVLLAAIPVVAAGGKEKNTKADKKRAQIDSLAKETLDQLLAKNETAKGLYDSAHGYAAFGNWRVLGMRGDRGTIGAEAHRNSSMVSPSSGHDVALPQLARRSGVAIEVDTGKRTYMNMDIAGVGIDGKKDSLVFLFQDAKIFDDFVENGWQAGTSATAASEPGAGFVNGIAIYQITASGLIAEVNLADTNCWKDDKLNESRTNDTVAPDEIEDPVGFDTECGEAAVPPGVFADVLCLGLCMEGQGRVGCRHSESRGNWYDRPAVRIDTIAIKIIGMVEVEDLAGQLEGLTGWEVVVDSVDGKRLLKEGEWRTTWSDLSELRFGLEGRGKVRIVADENARRVVVGSALLTPEDYEQEVRELESAANSGDVIAAYHLGVLYFEGEGISQSDDKAVEWWRRAAKGGSPAAQSALGGMYYKGRGVKQSNTKAAEWYRKAIARGYHVAQRNLCSMFYAKEIKLSGIEEFNCLRQAADQGVAEAQYDLGREYARDSSAYPPFGSRRVKAYVWLSLAAAQGYKDADKWQRNVGRRLTPDELAEAEAQIREWKPTP